MYRYSDSTLRLLENMKRNFGGMSKEARERVEGDQHSFIDEDGYVIKLEKKLPSVSQTAADIRWKMTMPKFGTPDDSFESREDFWNDKLALAENIN